jgi:hypothetical protein
MAKYEFTILFIVEADDIPSAIKQVHPKWERGEYTLLGVMEKKEEEDVASDNRSDRQLR